MENVVLPAFLVVEHELNRYISVARPVGMRRIGSIAAHVSWVTHRCSPEDGGVMEDAGRE
jgi:hypothetical protein